MFDLVTLLFVSTMVARLALAGALLWLLLGPGRSLDARSRALWGFAAVLVLVVALDNLVYEVLGRIAADAADESTIRSSRRAFFHFAYLFHGVLSAAFPIAVLERLVDRGRRGIFRAILGAEAVIFLVAIAAGALVSWDTLLGHTRILSFIAIAGYLGFWAILLLGGLRPVDVYFAGFLGARTVFVVLLPVQEVFFQWVGLAAAADLWAVNQSLQLAMTVVQLALAVALVWTLSRGRRVRRLGAPLPA